MSWVFPRRLTLRDETEWVETVAVGWNKLVGAEPEAILEAWFNFSPPAEHPPIFGQGIAGQQIAQILDSEPVIFGQSFPNPFSHERAVLAAAAVMR